MNEPGRVEVLLDHPHGSIWVPLEEWMRVGPGERPLLQPSAARRESGEALPLSVVPLRYRNTRWSRWLVATGWLERPWN